MLNFNHLYYFHVTAVEGTIKAAAERLGVTQPTVSEQVRLLENKFGVKLFERNAPGLKLTEAGRQVFEHTMTMFETAERLAAALGRKPADATTALRVGITPVIARTLAPELVVPLLTIEGCRCAIRTGELVELVRDLRTHQLDVVVGESAMPTIANELEVAALAGPTLVAVASPEVEPADDWHDVELLEYRVASAYHADVEGFLKEKSLRPRSAGELDDPTLMLEAVVRGAFVAFVPHGIAREKLAAGHVKRLVSFEPKAKFHAAFHRGRSIVVTKVAIDRLLATAGPSA